MATFNDKTFADRLRELRKKAGLTQGELARRASMHRQTISLYEQGTPSRPQSATQIRLAEALGVPVDTLGVDPENNGQYHIRAITNGSVITLRATVPFSEVRGKLTELCDLLEKGVTRIDQRFGGQNT